MSATASREQARQKEQLIQKREAKGTQLRPAARRFIQANKARQVSIRKSNEIVKLKAAEQRELDLVVKSDLRRYKLHLHRCC
jgi:hypothetical protein